MIAFTIAGRPIYRYGIFYLLTFASGYGILRRLGTRNFFSAYPNVQYFLTKGRDDLVLVALLGVMFGGRFGHVFLYDWTYYSTHLGEIFAFWEGGMSFIGGVIGVVVGLGWLAWRKKLSFNEIVLLGDIILCIVPIGIILGRIANGLNQELRGRPVVEFSQWRQTFFTEWGLVRVYETVDMQPRVNTNILQAILEGGVTALVGWFVMVKKYMHGRITPGLISGIFFMTYGLVRFAAEELKELPSQEMRGQLSVTQWVMLVFFFVGRLLIKRSRILAKEAKKLRS